MATRYSDRDYERSHYGDRDLFDRASDEVRAWFGDNEAERRRRLDERTDEQREREDRYARSSHRFDDVRAHDVMTRNVVAVHPYDTVERAARLMGEGDCGALPVVDGSNRLIGVVTDRDITIRIAGRGMDPRRARVDECMTDRIFACYAEDAVESCMRQMARRQIRRLPIVDGQDRLVGIISQSDLARHAGSHPGSGERRAVADTLCAVSEPRHASF